MTAVQDLAEEIVAREGGFVNDPSDPGGATNHGVTIGTLRRLGFDLTGDGIVTEADVRQLTRAQAVSIYVDHYFRKPGLDRLPQSLTGLNQVPEPLWWLLGAIVGFYFGAREAHHFRARAPASDTRTPTGQQRQPPRGRTPAPKAAAPDNEPNAALDDWRLTQAAPPTAGAREAS